MVRFITRCVILCGTLMPSCKKIELTDIKADASDQMILTTLSTGSVVLPSIFSNGMILQQNSSVSVWGWSDSSGVVSVSPSWNGLSYNAMPDSAGRWEVILPTPVASKVYRTISINGGEILLDKILIGEVWLASGQSNMEMPLKGFSGQPVSNADSVILHSLNPYIRFFDVANHSWGKPKEHFFYVTAPRKWLAASTTNSPNFSATGYFFAKALYDSLDIPIGIIAADVGGSGIKSWMSREALQAFPGIVIKPEADTSWEINDAAGLFNGMISPVLGYGIKGAIWYQGEHNRQEPELYSEMLPAMVQQWRTDWGIGNFPFYFAQIAPYIYRYDVNRYNIPRFREMQAGLADEISNAGVAILTDAGSLATVHPPDKQLAGNRLSYLALAKTYGFTALEWSGPVYTGMTVVQDSVFLSFDYNDGLYFTNNVDTSVNFQISGVSGTYKDASAKIMPNGTIRVYSPTVVNPQSVRYAYKPWVVGDLFNQYHLPASTFCTDTW